MSKDSVIILLIYIAFVGWAFAIGMRPSIGIIDNGIDRLRGQVIELRDMTEEKCIDLLRQ